MHGCVTSRVADDIIIQKHTSMFQHSLHVVIMTVYLESVCLS